MSTAQAVRRIADKHESRMTRVVRDAVADAQASFDVAAATIGFERHIPTMVEGALVAANGVMIGVLGSRMPDEIESAFAEAGQATARLARNEGDVLRAAKEQGPIGNLNFNLTNQTAVDWMRTRSGTLIANISRENMLAIRTVLTRSFTDGIPTDVAARSIRPLIGLTDAQAQAVLNLRQRLIDSPGNKVWAGNTAIRVPKGGADAAFLQKRTAQYAERLLNQRARMIARTESVAASNEGQRQLWAQAVEQNLLDPDVQRVWSAAADERTCPVCNNLNGEVTGLNEPFSDGIMGPPAHPMCRCSQGLTTKRGKRKPRGQNDLGNYTNAIVEYKPSPSYGRRGRTKLYRESKNEAWKRVTRADTEFTLGKDLDRMHQQFPALQRTPKLSKIQFKSPHDANGTYYPSEQRIVIKSSRTLNDKLANKLGNFWSMSEEGGDSMLITFRHEYGHHVHHQLLTESRRSEWADIFYARKRAEWQKLVSEYSSTNDAELFAESFAAWTHPSYRMGQLPQEIEAFFEKNLPRAATAPAPALPASQLPAMPTPSPVAVLPIPPPVPPAFAPVPKPTGVIKGRAIPKSTVIPTQRIPVPPAPAPVAPGTVRLMTQIDVERITALASQKIPLAQIAEEYTRLLGKRIYPSAIKKVLQTGQVATSAS